MIHAAWASKQYFRSSSALLKHSRYLLQLLPRAGLNICHQSSTHHYGSINALLGRAWREKKTNRYWQKIIYLFETAYFNCRYTANQPSFLLLCWTFLSFFITVLLQFSMHPAFIKKKKINDLNAMLPTIFSLCYYSASFTYKTIFEIAKSSDFSLLHLECSKITLKDETMWTTY